MNGETQIPKRRLTRRDWMTYAAIGVVLAALAGLAVKGCWPPEQPIIAAQREVMALGCAPGQFVLGVAVIDGGLSETSWGYDCVVEDAARAPDCDAVASAWASSARGALEPFDVTVRVGDPRVGPRPGDRPLCRRHYDGRGALVKDMTNRP
jgi:hypothetical protein